MSVLGFDMARFLSVIFDFCYSNSLELKSDSRNAGYSMSGNLRLINLSIKKDCDINYVQSLFYYSGQVIYLLIFSYKASSLVMKSAISVL